MAAAAGRAGDDDDDVQVTGTRTWAERDAELRKHAVVIDDDDDDAGNDDEEFFKNLSFVSLVQFFFGN